MLGWLYIATAYLSSIQVLAGPDARLPCIRFISLSSKFT